MYKPVNAVEVRIWGKRVGAIARDPVRGYYAFEYFPDFIKTGIELAPLTMPLLQSAAPYIFEYLPDQTFFRLPAMLADALPDDFGNSLIDAWMAQHGVAKSLISALDRLAYMGKRGMGALEFHPERSPASIKSTAIELSHLVEAARKAVSGSITGETNSQTALSSIIRVGTSAGGARAKAVIAWNPDTGEILAGQFSVPHGFEHWLIKFDGVVQGSEFSGSNNFGRIEFIYNKMAKIAGLNTAPCRLLEENGRAHFMTQRFDRMQNKKHHMQTLCAMAELDYKKIGTHDYNQLFMTIERLKLPYSAKEEAFRRMVFNVLAKNCDDHSKNFSFILRQEGEWELAPAYDITYAFNPSGKWTSQHLMSVNGKFQGITNADFNIVADRFGIGTANKVVDKVVSAITKFRDLANESELPDNEIMGIEMMLQK
jgi:serine/threonine-protein kinase HipA